MSKPEIHVLLLRGSKTEVPKFIRPVAHHRKAFLTGSSPVAALFVYQSTGHAVIALGLLAVVVFGILAACFKAWDDQFRLAEAENAKNLKPLIKGEVLYATFAGRVDSS
jgi:hypothetical protein